MEIQGIDLTCEPDELPGTISWHDPHPMFVIVLVGVEEKPFGIQKDLLCAHSAYYREEFSKAPDAQVEHVVKLDEFDSETFGCFQCFIYTGEVYDRRAGKDVPSYTILLNVWQLATKLKMAPLRMEVINAMYERRLATRAIPGPDLLIEAWEYTDEGSALRKMLTNWVAENLRDIPEFRPQLAKLLPKEILSELVIVMADPTSIPIFPAHSSPEPQRLNTNGIIDVVEEAPKLGKRSRKSEPILDLTNGGYENHENKPVVKKSRKSIGGSELSVRKAPRKFSLANGYSPADRSAAMTPEKELDFCKDLIQRMLSGPGFWTRLVGPFKKPVDPAADKVPNYFDVVKKPMDLSTIRDKMNTGSYSSAAEFEADIKQIFQNCYEYWTEEDSIFKLCEQFEKYFYEKWSVRHKWQPNNVKMEMRE